MLLGNRINVPNLWKSYGKVASKEHMKGGIFYKMTPPKKVQFIERVAKTKIGLGICLLLSLCGYNCLLLDDIFLAVKNLLNHINL